MKRWEEQDILNLIKDFHKERNEQWYHAKKLTRRIAEYLELYEEEWTSQCMVCNKGEKKREAIFLCDACRFPLKPSPKLPEKIDTPMEAEITFYARKINEIIDFCKHLKEGR